PYPYPPSSRSHSVNPSAPFSSASSSEYSSHAPPPTVFETSEFAFPQSQTQSQMPRSQTPLITDSYQPPPGGGGGHETKGTGKQIVGMLNYICNEVKQVSSGYHALSSEVHTLASRVDQVENKIDNNHRDIVALLHGLASTLKNPKQDRADHRLETIETLLQHSRDDHQNISDLIQLGDGRTAKLEEGLKNIRNVLNEVKVNQGALAIRGDIVDSIREMLTPALHEFFGSVHEAIKSSGEQMPVEITASIQKIFSAREEVTKLELAKEMEWFPPLTKLTQHLINQQLPLSSQLEFIREGIRDLPGHILSQGRCSQSANPETLAKLEKLSNVGDSLNSIGDNLSSIATFVDSVKALTDDLPKMCEAIEYLKSESFKSSSSPSLPLSQELIDSLTQFKQMLDYFHNQFPSMLQQPKEDAEKQLKGKGKGKGKGRMNHTPSQTQPSAPLPTPATETKRSSSRPPLPNVDIFGPTAQIPQVTRRSERQFLQSTFRAGSSQSQTQQSSKSKKRKVKQEPDEPLFISSGSSSSSAPIPLDSLPTLEPSFQEAQVPIPKKRKNDPQSTESIESVPIPPAVHAKSSADGGSTAKGHAGDRRGNAWVSGPGARGRRMLIDPNEVVEDLDDFEGPY
ncbi:hypothetical protein P7C73_g430, partial [Tremellales sp. Uapishka_1]